MIQWNDYPNFRAAEFNCSHSGKNEMKPEFMEILQKIRIDFMKPMIITSGYRDVTHPIEAAKESRGEHTYGVACDVAIRGVGAIELIQIAAHHGIRRIGVSQKGSGRFLHLGIGNREYEFNASLWSY